MNKMGYNLRTTILYIKSDLYRYTKKTDFFSYIKEYFHNPAFRYQTKIRLCNSHGIIKIYGLIMKNLFPNKNLLIPWRTKIGYGLYIGHNGPVVISSTAKIGNNCNLSQFTTIGSNKGEAAIIGDNVYIGPSCCIVENVHIGNNVTIGAGSVVTKDIPDNATAAGNYAKVLNYNDPARFIGNKFEQFIHSSGQ